MLCLLQVLVVVVGPLQCSKTQNKFSLFSPAHSKTTPPPGAVVIPPLAIAHPLPLCAPQLPTLHTKRHPMHRLSTISRPASSALVCAVICKAPTRSCPCSLCARARSLRRLLQLQQKERPVPAAQEGHTTSTKPHRPKKSKHAISTHYSG